MMKLRLLFVLVVMAPLASCTDWLGGSEKEIPLPGKRISLKTQQSGLAADAGVKDEPIVLLAMPANAAWPQVQGNATGVSGNLAFGKAPHLQNSVSVGEGAAFSSPLIPPPIVADGMVFAMDGSGTLSAHHADDIDKLYWKSTTLMHGEEDESPLLGGGLAWSKGTLFAANDEGKVAAFNASNGSRRWVKELKLPLRSPPRVAGNLLLLLTADNQLLALLQSTGDLSWSHRGISEVAGKLQASSPAIRDNTVLVTYSSGEVSALDLPSGNPLWSDNLAGAGPDSADPATFSAVAPLMATGLSFAGSSNLLAALETEGGRRLWDRKIPCQQAPWLAGNYLFLLTPDHQVVAVRGLDGAIAWIKKLPKEDGETLAWHGPVVAGEKIWMVAENGWLLALSPQDGKEVTRLELPAGLGTAPVIANKTMYLLDKEAQLHLIK